MSSIVFAIVAAAHKQLVEQDLTDGQYNIVKCDQELTIETEIDGAALTVTIDQSHPLYQSLLDEFKRVDSIEYKLKHFSSVDHYRKVISLFIIGSIEATVNEFDKTIHVVVDHGGDSQEFSSYMIIMDDQWISIYEGSTYANKELIDLYVGDRNRHGQIMVDNIKLLLGI